MSAAPASMYEVGNCPISVSRWEAYGFDLDSLEEYKIHDISKEEAAALGFTTPSDGIYITYPREEDSRIRWKPSGFALQLSGAKYGQRPHTLPALYYPPTVPPTWKTDTRLPLMITEGEFKAIAVDYLVNRNRVPGVVPLAVGGVFSWQSKKFGIELIEELKEIRWQGRTVLLAFDMDQESNAMVALALNRLVNVLGGKGAVIRVLQWPGAQGKGIDDYLTPLGMAYDTWLEMVVQAQVPGHIASVLEMNSRFAYCEVQQQVFDCQNTTYITPRSFSSDFFTRTIQVQTGVKNGLAVMKTMAIGQYWLSSPLRRTVIEPCFKPGEGQLVTSHDRTYLNTWLGWGVGLRTKHINPVKGDVKPWYDFLYATFAGEKPEHVEYLVKRLAWMFQQPQKKHPTWLYLMGRPLQGKSTLIKIISTLVGTKYTANVDESIVRGQFAEWRNEKLLVTFDDSSITDHRVIRQLLKRLTTEENSQVNLKYVKAQTAENYFSFIFATNSVDALLDHDDRRAFVLEADCKWSWEKGEWATFDAWRQDSRSMQALLFHLLYEVKVDSTFYTEIPPKTNARELVIEVGESSWDDLINYMAMGKSTIQWNLPASGGVRKWKPTIFTVEMLRSIFALRNGDNEKFKATSATLVGKLVRYGARRCSPMGVSDQRKRLMLGDEQLTLWTWDYVWLNLDKESYVHEYKQLKATLPELFPSKPGAKF